MKSNATYPWHRPLRRSAGMTLIEILVAIAIAAIVTSVALPSYRGSILKGKARTASTDLVALGVTMENRFQKTLQYPAYNDPTAIPALPASRTGEVATDFGSWAPSQSDAFTYTVQSSSTEYHLTATAGHGVSCTLSLSSGNVRTATGADCGFSAW